MEFLKIVMLGIVAAVMYGLVHDQITARVSLEYFTIGHSRVIASDSPTLLATYWGVAATWWVGALLGLCLGLAARVGSRPSQTMHRLIKPVGLLMLCTGALAGLVGGAAFVGAAVHWISIPVSAAPQVPPERERVFLAVQWTHLASYAVGTMRGLALCISVWLKRRHLATPAVNALTAPP